MIKAFAWETRKDWNKHKANWKKKKEENQWNNNIKSKENPQN